MSVHTVNINEAEGHLAELIELACQGDDVQLALNNGQIIKLVLEVPSKRQGLFGMYANQIHISEDFDEEMPESFLFEGK